MSQNTKIATVFGGTGFIGTQVVRELARRGYTVKVATRIPERAYFLRPCGVVGQIVPFACDYNELSSIVDAVKGSELVVNCIGMLFERRKGDFERAHVRVPEMIAKACKGQNVKRFVHISALACDRGTSRYAKTKLEGERAVHKGFPQATILRPSVVFGPEDDFFNMFAELSRYTPILPLIGGGKTKFQPVYVGDVADAVMAGLTLSGDKDPRGKIYELGGPDVVSFREIYGFLAEYTGRRRLYIWLPFPLAKFKAFFWQWLPRPIITIDQVESLKTDNVVSEGTSGLADLGIVPASMALILPTYLERFRPGGSQACQRTA